MSRLEVWAAACSQCSRFYASVYSIRSPGWTCWFAREARSRSMRLPLQPFIATLVLPPSAARLTETELAADEMRPLEWFAGRIAFVGWTTLILACCGTFSLIRAVGPVAPVRARAATRRRCAATEHHRFRTPAGLWRRSRRSGDGALVRAGCWSLLHDVLADFPTWDGGTLLRYPLILLFAVLVGALHRQHARRESLPANCSRES